MREQGCGSSCGDCLVRLVGLVGVVVSVVILLGVFLTPDDPGDLETQGYPASTPRVLRPSWTPALRTPTARPLQRTMLVKSTPTPTRTSTPGLRTWASCEQVPARLLRLDTQGRVAVKRELVPSQPDGDNDGFACGTQLEHKRGLIHDGG